MKKPRTKSAVCRVIKEYAISAHYDKSNRANAGKIDIKDVALDVLRLVPKVGYATKTSLANEMENAVKCKSILDDAPALGVFLDYVGVAACKKRIKDWIAYRHRIEMRLAKKVQALVKKRKDATKARMSLAAAKMKIERDNKKHLVCLFTMLAAKVAKETPHARSKLLDTVRDKVVKLYGAGYKTGECVEKMCRKLVIKIRA